MEKTPVKIFKYKNHITHVGAAEIPTWYACMFDCGSFLAFMHNSNDDACGHGSQASRKPTESFWCALMLSIWWEYFRLWRRTNADLSHNEAK